jgi:organic radical activating enzyme
MDTVFSLEKKLKEKYSVECVVQIESLETKPSSTLYQTLLPFVRDPYEPNYRFVFFNFAAVHDVTLQHLVNTINFLDISPSFVLVLTNQQLTVDFLSKHLKDSTVEYLPEVSDTKSPTNTTPEFNVNNKLCAYAWAGLHVHTDGTVAPCCDYKGEVLDDHGTPYNVKTVQLKEIFSSNYMKNLRAEFVSKDTLPSKCVACKIAEDSGVRSRRELAMYKMQNSYNLIDWDLQNSTIRFVGGHTGNLCNLKCRICFPVFSSSIAVEEITNKQHAKQLLKDTRWAKTNHQFWEELKTLVPHVCNFEFLGGEPLMLKENIDFMQYLIDQGHSRMCTFEFVTNGTIYSDLLELPDTFYRLTVTVSIDDIDKRFDLQRSGADFRVVEKNLDRYLRHKHSSLKIGVNTTVNIQNVFYLPELLAWLDTKQLDHHYFNILHTPHFLSIFNMTLDAKHLVLSKLKSCNDQRLTSIITTIEQAETCDGKEFVKYMQHKDLLRKENFKSSHPEIAQAMGL